MTVTPITPRMDLARIVDELGCNYAEAAFVLLELIAEGHWAKDLGSMKIDELHYALNRACARMDALGIEA